MVRIEPATAGDLPQLVELLQALFSIETYFAAEPGRQRRGLERLLREPPQRATLLVARGETGKAVGMVSVQLVVSTAEGSQSAWIEDVIVDKAVRGRGLGRLLVDAALAWAAERGATRAQLLAEESNEPALLFYSNLGWQQTRMIMLRKPLP